MVETFLGAERVSAQWCSRVIAGAWVLGETYWSDKVMSPALRWDRRGAWFTAPEDKSRNSWRWLCWRWRRSGPIYALRWTLPKWFV